MTLSLRSCFLSLVIGAVLTACGNQAAEAPPHEVLSSTQQLADAGWVEFTSSGERPVRVEDKDALSYFMREVELSDIRRRELGLKFWEAYPDDPRRYEWLQLTVHMPPHYVVDIREWAANETEVAPNGAAVNKAAIAEWNALYASMRGDFWTAADITDLERRYLWLGELVQKILRMREAHVRGEAVDTAPILDEVLAFGAAYPKSQGEYDQEHYFSAFSTLSNLVLRKDIIEDEHGPVFAWTKETALAYWSKMMEADVEGFSKYNAFLGDYLQQHSKLPTLQYLTNDNVNERAWRTLITTHSSNQPATFVGGVVGARNREVETRKLRGIGIKYWRRYPDHDWQVTWAGLVHWSSPNYYKRFTDGIYQYGASAGREYSDPDLVAKAKWESTYSLLRVDLWKDPITTDEERSRIRAKEIWAEMGDAKSQWARLGNRAAVDTMLDHIHELWTVHKNAKDTWQYSTSIVRGYKSYGLSDDDLLSFFEPMLKYDNEELRTLAQGAFNTIELKRTPFEFAATTMHGEPFDMKDLLGQIVLVDHWNTDCSACIAAMPRLSEIYSRYKGKGFEVVSIAYDGTAKRKRVLRIEDQLGLTWTAVNGEGQREVVSDKYGYQGFPQYMLLNRDGTLYAATGEVDMGRNLEALLDELLAAEKK